MVYMLETATLDELDCQIAAALQLNGRASWKQIATALEMPESTVTRRGTHLLSRRAVAVTGVLDHLRCGLGISVYMRFRARPGRTLSVAHALARHSAPRFVTITLGSFDVAAEVVVANPADILTMLADLENIENVLESQSTIVLRKFTAFEEWDPGTLPDAGRRLLRPEGTPATYPHRQWVEPETLTEQELAIARFLAADGRASYAAIASAAGISESTAARRVDSLVQRGCLRFRVIVDPVSVGLGVEFMLWLNVEPNQLERAGEALATHAATQYVSAATGQHNLILQGVLPAYGDLYLYTTGVISALPGILAADMTVQVRTFKRAWVPIGTDGRPEPKETP